MAPRLPSREQVTRALVRSAEGSWEFSDALNEPLLGELSPWEVRVLFALGRRLKCQEWVGKVVVENLGGNLDDIASGGYSGHPKHLAGKGLVPDLVAWEYCFHGVGCHLTNRVTGESIDVDFVDGGSRHIDPFFYTNDLGTLGSSVFPEKSLSQRTESADAWQADIAPLVATGWLLWDNYRLTFDPARIQILELLDPLIERINNQRTPTIETAQLLCSLGDVVSAAELLKERCPKELSMSAEATKQTRLGVLMGRISGSEREARYALQALDELDPPGFGELLSKHMVSNQSNGSGISAANLLTARVDLGNLPLIEDALSRLTEKNNPTSYCRIRCCMLILQAYGPSKLPASLASDIMSALVGCEESFSGESGLLLYLVDREAGARKLADGLTSTIPASQSETASALTIIGDSTTARLLLSAAFSGPSAGMARTALAEFPDSDVREQAMKLGYFEELKQGVPDTGPPYPLAHVADQNRAAWLRADIREMRACYGSLVEAWLL